MVGGTHYIWHVELGERDAKNRREPVWSSIPLDFKPRLFTETEGDGVQKLYICR